MLTLEQQAAFVEEAPEIFLPIPGGWGHYQVGSPVIQAAAGVEMRLWRTLYWTGEYKFTRTREQVNVFSGTARSLLESHHLVTGPVIHF
jgi:hypothetical protein